MLFVVLSGLIVSLLLVPFGRIVRAKGAGLLSLFPAALFAYFASFIPAVFQQSQHVSSSYLWVPSLGINLDFYMDGLSLLFALLITGIGTLVFLYASNYLKGHAYLDRFYAYLSLFMASMLGMVLSDNTLLLFIFWELTSISSYFLIGFNNENRESRQSALTALGITGGGGLMLLAGFVLLSFMTGTYSIQELSGLNIEIQNHALYGLLLLFVFGGAFTKSAQFPFHFWLPGAMKAPTPVSAYLHSATMVKAGIFLLARFSPILGGTDLWKYTLLLVGGFTMLYAAFHALFRTDLKSILAYTTISALGVMTFLIGMGTQHALIAVSVFILVHALYKATLFLVAGIIDHETGTREVTRLGGLRKVLMPVFIAGLFAALSSAGLPLTFGFIGKDLIYEATLAEIGYWSTVWTSLAYLTNVFLLVAGLVAGVRPFIGQLPREFEPVHLPSPMLWAPPLLLATLGILFGLFPSLVQDLAGSTAQAFFGQPLSVHLKIWHGFTPVLWWSLATLGVGAALFFMLKPSVTRLASITRLERVSSQYLFHRLHRRLLYLGRVYTGFWHNGFLRSYLFRIVLFSAVLVFVKLFAIGWVPLNTDNISPVTFHEFVVFTIMLVAVYLTITTPSRLTAVVATGVVGYCICLFFVFYSAPDLALTQFTIDTLTVVLFVLVLFRLPQFLKFANNRVKMRDAFLSILFGLGIGITALHALNEPVFNEVSAFYGDNAYRLAKGKNVVNVILVDFRGMDTMFEIVVLSIAAIGVYSLLKLRLKPTDKE